MNVRSGPELASFLERTTGDRYHYPFMFLATTGCRRGEALGLRWRDVDLKARTASIRQQVVPLTKASGRGREGRIVARTKGGDARVIELDERTVAMLRAWRKKQAQEKLRAESYEDHGLAFPRPDGKAFHPEDFAKSFDRRVRRAGFGE